MKKVIRLTESRLYDIIKETVARVIRENEDDDFDFPEVGRAEMHRAQKAARLDGVNFPDVDKEDEKRFRNLISPPGSPRRPKKKDEKRRRKITKRK